MIFGLDPMMAIIYMSLSSVPAEGYFCRQLRLQNHVVVNLISVGGWRQDDILGFFARGIIVFTMG